MNTSASQMNVTYRGPIIQSPAQNNRIYLGNQKIVQ
jgi:hypothetical protein